MKRHAPQHNFEKVTLSVSREHNRILEGAMVTSGLTKSEILRLIIAAFIQEGGTLRIDLPRAG